MRLETLIKAMIKKGYEVFESDSKPFNLNIVGVRDSSPKTNFFNDSLSVFWKYEGQWNMLTFLATTLAGLKYLKTPMNPKGYIFFSSPKYLLIRDLKHYRLFCAFQN